MANRKYDKYILENVVEDSEYGKRFYIIGEKEFKSDYTAFIVAVTKPQIMEPYAHAHDFDMYLHILKFEPAGLEEDLGAEIELCLGEEQEKHLITKPTTVYIPAGMVHCPLEFKKITKPLLLIHTNRSSTYYKKS